MKKILLLILSFANLVPVAQTIAIEAFASGFSNAVEITHAGDSRLFVVQKAGLIRILNSDGTINPTPFLDVSSLTVSSGERGLLGLVFHPNYASNGYFFINYTNTSGNTVIARYTVNPADSNLANPTGVILMTITQPYSNHNGGSLKFGPDGYLYIGMGDGGSAGDPENRAQNITTNLGKMLRIDVDVTTAPYYASPPSNPYVGITGNDEIWAIGLRNPWKFSFNRLTGDLWIADVGQNNIEEINKITTPLTAGLNFGWRCYEGNVAYNTSGCAAVSTMTMPIAQYNHSNGCSITGGYEYTGSLYPAFQNKYFFADYCVNRLGYVDTTNNTISYTPNFSGSNNFTSLGEDMNGELYITNSTTIYKIIDNTVASSSSFEKNGFILSPNPVKDSFTITNDNHWNISRIEVYDLTGKQYKATTITNSEVLKMDISGLQNGVYLVKILTEDGNNFNTKLIKQ
ncbi:PQQ-dependent sugar dehydrogenase [Flavobacterium chuncheonense]|uniref:PQQ-dependent sugar dehydrogenase n=1 Tax=Flavobacterium chuncheonense TaxID=2026653 RepID=A0ABW5YMU2_9FLAO